MKNKPPDNKGLPAPFLGLGLSARRLAESARVSEVYPARATEYYLSLSDPSDPSDPVLEQCLPDARELDKDGFDEDGLNEDGLSPVPRLVRKYKDRAALLVTNNCAVHCRFCFRKRRWKDGEKISDINDAELGKVLRFLKKHSEIREILVTGGDPLTLKNSRLKEIMDALKSVRSIDILRICTRMPVVNPSRVDDALAKMLGRVEGLWAATHFNHPRELTPESKKACVRLVRNGVPVVNQTVLLKGVNDSPETLEKLFRGLAKIKVKPYYLFHIDPVGAVRHFSTGIDRGLEIMESLRASLSFLATPAFAIDLPEGGGKVVLAAERGKGGRFKAVDGRKMTFRE